jgi:hypothetical protein
MSFCSCLQVDISEVDQSKLAAAAMRRLRTCSGLTPEGFHKWLAARTSGIVQLSGEWLFEEVPKGLRQIYLAALAKEGYLQVGEGTDYMLLMSLHGLELLQQLLLQAELHTMQHKSSSSSSSSKASGSPSCASGAAQGPRGSGVLSGAFHALRGSLGSIIGGAGGPGQQGQGQDGDSAGLGGSGPTKSSSAGTSASTLLPDSSCIKVALPSSGWWGRGLDSSRISDSLAISGSTSNNTVLAVEFRREEPECTISVNVNMQACMKQEVRAPADLGGR